MKKFTPAKAAPKKVENPRDVANQKAAAEKTAARGTNARPAHKIYPHLD